MFTLQENISLQPYNTFGIDANARWMAFPGSTEELLGLLDHDRPGWDLKFILGGGSNVLFTRDFNGLILHPVIKGIEKIRDTNEFIWVRAGCGENWDDLVDHCVQNNWGGLENLSHIPGHVGGSPVQNIGAYGVEVKDCIESVEAILIKNKKRIHFSAAKCKFGYRDSIFKKEMKGRCIITHVTFRLRRDPVFTTHYPDLEKELDNYSDTTIQNIRKAIISIRSKKLPDPAKLGNAGSFFKNPFVSVQKAESLRQYFPAMPGYDCEGNRIKLSAAWLIEQCHWKGRKVGSVEAYRRQPLVIVNRGGATGSEIIQYAQKIQRAVRNRFGIMLELEVNVL